MRTTLSICILTAMLLAAPSRADDNDTISIELSDVDIEDVARMFSAITGAGEFVLDSSIPANTRVTITANDMPWRKAMKMILEPRHLYLLDPAKSGDPYIITATKPAKKIDSELLSKHAAETNSKETQQAVDKLIMQLGAKEYKNRVDAATQLTALGTRAVPSLLQAAKSADPEISVRASELLLEIQSAIEASDKKK